MENDRFGIKVGSLGPLTVGLLVSVFLLILCLGIFVHWSFGAVSALSALYIGVFTSHRNEGAREKELLTILNDQGQVSLEFVVSGSDRVFGWSPTEQVFVYLQKGYEIERISPTRIGRIEMCIFDVNLATPFVERDGRFFATDATELSETDLDWENSGIRIFDAFTENEIARFFCETKPDFFTWVGVLRDKCPHLEF